MGRTIRFGVILKPLHAEVHTQELRELRQDEVLIKMEACNVCSGDWTQYVGLRNHQGFPHAGGHEWAGTILEKGDDVIQQLRIGDRVGGLAGNPCGQCEKCMTGNYIECPNNVFYVQGPDGYYGDKLFATYAIVKAQNVVPVSKRLPAGHAAMLEPLSTAVQASKQGRVRPLEDVVVVGAGTMGMLNAQVARAYGARVMITELSPKKIQRAREAGFTVIDVGREDPAARIREETGGKGADAVFVCVANDKAYEQGFSMLKEMRGRMVFFPAGYPAPAFSVAPNDIHYRMLELIGSYGSTVQDYYDAAGLMEKGLVNVADSMEGITFPLEQFDQALQFASEADRYRVTVDLSGQ